MTDLPKEELERLQGARLHDPHRLLGPHRADIEDALRAFLPQAQSVRIQPLDEPMQRYRRSALFQWRGAAGRLPERYRLVWTDATGHEHEQLDPYAFPPDLPMDELARFNRGEHHRAWQLLGAHVVERDDVMGTRFACWAPNAERVSVVGDFNGWDGRVHPMAARGSTGVWELFLPGIGDGSLYKFEIRNARDGTIHVKTDPYGRRFQMRPETAAAVAGPSRFAWADDEWMATRGNWLHQPISVYEVHLGSWQRHPDGSFFNYRELADELVPYVQRFGFTHIELLPVTEHPLDASWGYQTTGYFAPTRRHGEPDDLRYFIDRCHQAGIGVYLDWVPAHFPRDGFALARFDGTALYEHAHPLRAEHPDWGTLVFNYGRSEVRSFLYSSALYWLEDFHIDGLRVDAVASMLYLDYSREPGRWMPNIHGGNEDLEAIEFVRGLNNLTHRECPGSVTIAEESTAWPGVSRPANFGGLGFSMKWNMGWMHDTLQYMSKDPVHRHYHHQDLSFGLLYAFSENFVLPFSHDEVVHQKGSLYAKMPGDEWQKFANLRLLFGYQFTYPGKKLLFMGAEIANPWEWNDHVALPHDMLNDPKREGLARLLQDLNRLYREEPALHRHDFEPEGFAWIDCHAAAQSVITYRRRHGAREVVVVLNFTPVPRHGYRIGVPRSGHYRELLNSDAAVYGGGDVGNGGGVDSEDRPWMDLPYSVALTLPPLGALVLQHEGDA